MSGGAPNGAVLLPPGTLVVSQPVSQPQLMSLPASHTWSDSGAGGGERELGPFVTAVGDLKNIISAGKKPYPSSGNVRKSIH